MIYKVKLDCTRKGVAIQCHTGWGSIHWSALHLALRLGALMTTRRMVLGGLAAAAVVLAALYFGSPLLAVHGLRSAALAGDADKLQRMVDFPAVRESLKGQLNALLLAEMQKDPEMANNPFAGLALAIVPGIVNQAIEGYVTADGISAMMSAQAPQQARRGGAAAANSSGAAPEREPLVSQRYRDLDTYVIASTDPADAETTFAFVLHRSGLFGWKLARIDLPKTLPSSAR